MLTQPKYVMKIGTIDGERVLFYRAGTGSHCYALACEVAEGPDSGQTVKHTLTLINKEGVISEKTMELIRDVFGCKEFDPFWLVDAAAKGELDAIRFELTGKVEKGDKGGEYWKGEWLNALGGGAKMPEGNVDRKAFASQFGSKFRALTGGTTSKAPTTPPAAKKSPPPPQTGPTATMEQAWEECCKRNGNVEGPSTEDWTNTMAELFPGKTNSDLTPHDWGKLKEKFSDNVPA